MRTLLAKYILVLFLASTTVLTAWPLSTMALDLQTAKSQGLVGEKADGYLGVVNSAAGVQQLVDSVNRARRQHYEEIAQRNGTSVSVVEQLAGKKAIEMTSSGQFVQLPPGSWLKK